MLKHQRFPKIQHLRPFKLVDQHASNDIMNMSNANMMEHAPSYTNFTLPENNSSLDVYARSKIRTAFLHPVFRVKRERKRCIHTSCPPCMYFTFSAEPADALSARRHSLPPA